jgi:hypothetical protein
MAEMQVLRLWLLKGGGAAFNADILIGDLVGPYLIQGMDDFYRYSPMFFGKEVDVKVVRDGQELVKSVHVGLDPARGNAVLSH